VRRISIGITTLPTGSTRLTIPVTPIFQPSFPIFIGQL
jgi:hypothetical protein